MDRPSSPTITPSLDLPGAVHRNAAKIYFEEAGAQFDDPVRFCGELSIAFAHLSAYWERVKAASGETAPAPAPDQEGVESC